MSDTKDVPGIIRKRLPIYIGEKLRAYLKRRKEPLSTVVNTLAERYIAMCERAAPFSTYCLHAEMYDKVLREADHPLTPNEIATFPAMCEDWLSRNPDFPQEPSKTAIAILKSSSYHELVALIDKAERQL